MDALYILDTYINVRHYFSNDAESNFFKCSPLLRKSLLSIPAVAVRSPGMALYHFKLPFKISSIRRYNIQKEEDRLTQPIDPLQ